MVMEFIQYLTGGNLIIQAAFISGIISLTISLSGLWLSWKKLNMQEQKFDADRSQFEKQLKVQRENFEEQRRQFEITLQNQQSKTYKELITSERIKWFNGLRENIVDVVKNISELNMLIAIHDAKVIEEKMFFDQYPNKLVEIKYKATLIKLKLNPNEKQYINALDFVLTMPDLIINHKEYEDQYREYLMKFENASQIFLKTKWEKIKNEANILYS